MKKNVGMVDRMLRRVVGVGLIALAVIGVTPWGWLGVIPLVTGIIGWCPLYVPLGINTCKKDQAS